jgi:O-acetyl-ADP-ribose deacetylase (regulator of RNase III)
MQVDAIVNTTNEHMIGTAGVDLAVHTAAGRRLAAACAKLAPLGLGEAKITKGYRLPAKYVIHTSGPVWKGGMRGESILLRSCYWESLKLAVAHGCESVAFPLISSGTYGYPKDQVLTYAVQVITEFLNDHELTVYLCVFDSDSYEFSKKLFDDIREAIDDDYVATHEMTWRQRQEQRHRPRKVRIAEALVSEAAETKGEEKSAAAGKTLEDYLRSMDKPFAEKLFALIDERGMTDVACYKKANVDKKTFSKIRCNPKTYKPSKETAVAFAIALHLNLEQTQDLLGSAGLTLSRSFTFDRIIRYFIQREIYDVFAINEALFEFDQVLLGC